MRRERAGWRGTGEVKASGLGLSNFASKCAGVSVCVLVCVCVCVQVCACVFSLVCWYFLCLSVGGGVEVHAACLR